MVVGKRPLGKELLLKARMKNPQLVRHLLRLLVLVGCLVLGLCFYFSGRG
jgi:hypothetical protein